MALDLGPAGGGRVLVGDRVPPESLEVPVLLDVPRWGGIVGSDGATGLGERYVGVQAKAASGLVGFRGDAVGDADS